MLILSKNEQKLPVVVRGVFELVLRATACSVISSGELHINIRAASAII
jgi:hypothetical protein